MSTRTTSRDAYVHLVRTGQLLGKQRKIIDKLLQIGPATSGEILKKLRVANVNAWRARFTELQARGLIAESGTRRCAVSGRTCLVWEATDRTQALDRKRGHNVKNGAAAWRELATRLASSLDRAISTLAEPDEARNVLADYRKLSQQRRV